MIWGSVWAFFAMGGYALYVWGSYAAAAAVILIEVASLVTRGRAARRGLAPRARASD